MHSCRIDCGCPARWLTRCDFCPAQIRRGTRQHARESRGNVHPGIGGRLVSQAGSPRGSSEATLVHVPIPCELSKVPVRPSNRKTTERPAFSGSRKNSQSTTIGREGYCRFCVITWLAANPGRARVGGGPAEPFAVPRSCTDSSAHPQTGFRWTLRLHQAMTSPLFNRKLF
jgi:hypothetical protein